MIPYVPNRPTFQKKKFENVPRFQTGFGGTARGGLYPTYSTSKATTVDEPVVSPYEYLDTLREQFNKQPLQYKTDPATGKVVVSRTMAKTPIPEGMGKFPRFKKWFGEGDLTSSWILPQGAMGGKQFISRTTPQSDLQRQGAYRFGISNTGTTTLSPNPRTFWPGSAFNLPMRDPQQVGAGGGYTMPEPVFGSTIDYTTGKYYGQSDPYGYTDPYGTFDTQAKRPPRFKAWRSSYRR